MAIVDFRNLVQHAALHRYALNVVPVDSFPALDAALAVGHAQRAPLVLAPVAPSATPGMGKALFAACEVAGRDADIPVALMALHVQAEAGVTGAIGLGCSAVCIEPSTTDFPQIVAEVKKLAEITRSCGIAIGAALPDNPERPVQDRRPSAAECIAFAERAALDFLEVDIGVIDDGGGRRTKLDYARLRRIHDGAPVPLSTRVVGELRSDQVNRLIESGLSLVHHGAPRAEDGFLAQSLRLWGSAGRAAEVLAQCPPLQAVAHVVEFNVPAEALPGLDDILREGRRCLAAIAGVRSVATGEAISDRARYRYCWLVTFANEQVVDWYRHHRLHVEFADNLFRPVADDRLTIDFRLTEEQA